MQEQPLGSPGAVLDKGENTGGDRREGNKLCPVALVCFAVPFRMFHWKLLTKCYCEVSDFGSICVAGEGTWDASKSLGAGSLQGRLPSAEPQVFFWALGASLVPGYECNGLCSFCFSLSEIKQSCAGVHHSNIVPSQSEGMCHGLGGDRRS